MNPTEIYTNGHKEPRKLPKLEFKLLLPIEVPTLEPLVKALHEEIGHKAVEGKTDLLVNNMAQCRVAYAGAYQLIYAAYSDGQLAGYTWFRLDNSKVNKPYMFVEEWYVAKSFRHDIRLMKQLIAIPISYYDRIKGEKIEVHVSTARAERAWRNRGFTCTSLIMKFDGDAKTFIERNKKTKINLNTVGQDNAKYNRAEY